jgi:class 3 adenylate cyclase
VTACERCGFESPHPFRFCPQCGAPAGASARELRKTVTVLFSDVVGSTALGEALDPEAFRGILARYFDEVRRVLESHGGRLEKFIGDAVVAVFGVPVAREDDALRALRAAIAIRERLGELNDGFERSLAFGSRSARE